MGSLQAEGTARAGFGQLTQTHLLKPTAAFGVIETVFAEGWRQLAGRPREEYFAAHPLRPVFTYLRIVREPVPLDIDAPLRVRFTGRAGHYPARDGSRRYGLRDEVDVLDAGGRVVLRWLATVFWMRMERDGLSAFLTEPAPALLLDQEQELDRPPSKPTVEVSEAGRFRWTPRETDINRHVFFQSYLERAENALADGGVDVDAPASWSLWFTRPAFLGETTAAALGETTHGHLVELRKDDGTLCCSVLAD